METIIDRLRKDERLNPTFRMALADVLNAGGFVQIGTENGTPVYELKPEPKCDFCGRTAEFCICMESFI